MRKTSVPPVWLAVSGAILALAGCGDKVKAPGPVIRDPLAGAMPHIQPLEGLGNGLRFGEPSVDEATDSRPMHVTVPVRSVVDGASLNTRYKFEFLDRRGHHVSDTGWRFKALPPRAEEFVEGGAMDTDATDWRLKIEPAK